MYSRVLIVLACALALGLGHWAYRSMNEDLANAEIDARLSEVSFNDLAGKTHDFSEWAGKVLVINFWATWCPPCKEEMPELTRLQRELGDRGVQFIGIAVDDPDEVRAYLAENPVNYPILIGAPGGPEWAAELGNALQVLPFTAVIDRSGRVVRAKSGPFSRNELMDLLPGIPGAVDGEGSG